MFIVFLHSSMDSTNSCSAISGLQLNWGLELRPKPSTSNAYKGRFSLRGPRFWAHRPIPPPIPWTMTRGTFFWLVSLSGCSMVSVHKRCWDFGRKTYLVSYVFLRNAVKYSRFLCVVYTQTYLTSKYYWYSFTETKDRFDLNNIISFTYAIRYKSYGSYKQNSFDHLVFLTSISNKYFTQPYPVESFALLEPI